MKTCLYVLLNYVFANDLEFLYGKGSFIIVNNVKLCTVNNHYLIDCKLFMTDITLFEESGLDGVNFLIEESLKLATFEHDNFVLVVTYDLIS